MSMLKASLFAASVATVLLGCAIKPAGHITVYKSLGVVQCESQGMTLAQSERQLAGMGVDVIGSTCGVLEKVAFTSVCGAETGDIVLHTIDRRHEKLAEAMGYKDVIGLKTPDSPEGFRLVECQ